MRNQRFLLIVSALAAALSLPDFAKAEHTPGSTRAKLSSRRQVPLAPLDQESVAPSETVGIECPPPEQIRQGFKPIGNILTDIRPTTGAFPPDCSAESFTLTVDASQMDRGWSESTKAWQASGYCHRPLYFEDVPLERYGHTLCPPLQTSISAVRFFGSIPMLPYMMTLEPPRECVYTLGYYRPGDVAPRLDYRFPLRLDAATVQAAVVTGAVFLIP